MKHCKSTNKEKKIYLILIFMICFRILYSSVKILFSKNNGCYVYKCHILANFLNIFSGCIGCYFLKFQDLLGFLLFFNSFNAICFKRKYIRKNIYIPEAGFQHKPHTVNC